MLPWLVVMLVPFGVSCFLDHESDAADPGGPPHTCEGAVIMVPVLDGEDPLTLKMEIESAVTTLTCEPSSRRLRCGPADTGDECGFEDSAHGEATRLHEEVRASLSALRPGTEDVEPSYVDGCACRHY